MRKFELTLMTEFNDKNACSNNISVNKDAKVMDVITAITMLKNTLEEQVNQSLIRKTKTTSQIITNEQVQEHIQSLTIQDLSWTSQKQDWN